MDRFNQFWTCKYSDQIIQRYCNQAVLILDMLDKKDHSNIQFKRVNEKTGKEVAWENIVKGYKIDSDM